MLFTTGPLHQPQLGILNKGTEHHFRTMDSLSVCISLPLCVWVHVCIYACMLCMHVGKHFLFGCMYVCVHSCGGPMLMLQIILVCSCPLFVEHDPFNEAQSSPSWLGQLALQIPHFYFLRLELHTGYHDYLTFTLFSESLNSSYLRGKSLNPLPRAYLLEFNSVWTTLRKPNQTKICI